MSTQVKLDELASTLRDFDRAYLLTSGDDGVKVVGVTVVPAEDGLLIPTGSKGTVRNLERSSRATLLCPPRDVSGMTLIVDGDAAPEGEGFRLRPTGAILHRPAAAAGSCG